MPESQLHLDLRTALYLLLKNALGPDATVGSDQFVYWDASDPNQVLAPDVYAKLSPAASRVESWKTWERGAPDVAVEIASRSDAPEPPWQRKLHRYQQLGVKELVRFDAKADASNRLRVYNRIEDNLVERELTGSVARSLVMPLTWVIAPIDDMPVALRLARNTDGTLLVPTDAEARQAEATARQAETEARKSAEARVRELEAELAQLRK